MEIQSTALNLPASPASRVPGAQLGKDQFFELLVTQMRHQDPLAPQDSSAFIAQLAQFSSLEALQSLQGQMSTLNLLTSSLNNAQAVGLMGRSVTFESGSLEVRGGAVPSLAVELPSGAAGGSVRILDGAGNTVRTLEVPAGAGRQALPWDGKDAGGNRLQDGTYTIEVTGTDPDGGSVRGTSFLQGQVERVRFSDGLVYLEVAGQSLPLDLVVEIANAAPGGASSRVPAARAFSAF